MLTERSWGMSGNNKGFCECGVFLAGSRVEGQMLRD